MRSVFGPRRARRRRDYGRLWKGCEMRNLRHYVRAASSEEAVDIKLRHGEEAVYLAGGTDLLVHRPARVRVAIDIRHAGMDEVASGAEGTTIGGAALLRQVEHGLPSVGGGMLARAVRETAPWLIRNAATLAGNIANASPAADSVPALSALDRRLRWLGPGGEEVRAGEILAGPHGRTPGNRSFLRFRTPGTGAKRRPHLPKLR